MIKYRPHRGCLAEAVAEAREFPTVEEMKDYVYRSWMLGWESAPLFNREDIVIGEILGDDDRIGWKNVRHVCVKRMGSEDYMALYGSPQCIGWCGE